MIALGTYNDLTVVHIDADGITLMDDDPNEDDVEMILAAEFVPDGIAMGDTIEVFVTMHSSGYPVVTGQRPKAVLGEFAFLEVVDITEHGAFLDWGLEKDLFVPFGLQHTRMEVGRSYIVAISIDKAMRMVGASKLAGFFSYEVDHFSHGDKVQLLVYAFNPLGAQVIVDGSYTGLVHDSQATQILAVGDTLTGYVQQIRDDNKLDIILSQPGHAGTLSAQEEVLSALERAGGSLPLHDKSAPAEISATLGMSKKVFKRAIGGLYKARKIALSSSGITLIGEPPTE